MFINSILTAESHIDNRKAIMMNKFIDTTKGSISNYFHFIKSSDLGSFAVVGGLVIIAVIFQIGNKNFLTPLNLTNLMSQISAIGILSVGVILV